MISPTEILGRVAALSSGWHASTPLPAGVVAAVEALDGQPLAVVAAVLDEVGDLESRTVRDVMGRDGRPVEVHHYQACRAEDTEASWDHRPASAPVRALRRALMAELLGPEGLVISDVEPLAGAAARGQRLLFIGNHESVFDLVVLTHALETSGLGALAERLTFFVNPKIFNIAFVNFWICKSVALIKMPQSPRIAANESVMPDEEVRRRARHGFDLAASRLAAGDSLAIFPEGLRSDGLLHRFARAYLELLRPAALRGRGLDPDAVLLVPWAHRGVRALERLAIPTEGVGVRFGRPVAPTELFDALGARSLGVAGHVAGFLVSRLLPPPQRGLYGANPEAFLEHPHYRLRIKPHTLDEIRTARRLAEGLIAG